jgi:GNAT superfamily N-acetyltransferase
LLNITKIHVEETYSLRHEILRPHQTIEQCRYPGDLDVTTAHYGAFISEEIVGILSVYKAKNDQIDVLESWQFRAMATKENVRGKGLALKLFKELELYVLSQGGRCIWANARSKAVGFYEKAGYFSQCTKFDITGIGSHYLV